MCCCCLAHSCTYFSDIRCFIFIFFPSHVHVLLLSSAPCKYGWHPRLPVFVYLFSDVFCWLSSLLCVWSGATPWFRYHCLWVIRHNNNNNNNNNFFLNNEKLRKKWRVFLGKVLFMSCPALVLVMVHEAAQSTFLLRFSPFFFPFSWFFPFCPVYFSLFVRPSWYLYFVLLRQQTEIIKPNQTKPTQLVGWLVFILLRTFKRDDDPIKWRRGLSLEVAMEEHSKGYGSI